MQDGRGILTEPIGQARRLLSMPPAGGLPVRNRIPVNRQRLSSVAASSPSQGHAFCRPPRGAGVRPSSGPRAPRPPLRSPTETTPSLHTNGTEEPSRPIRACDSASPVSASRSFPSSEPPVRDRFRIRRPEVSDDRLFDVDARLDASLMEARYLDPPGGYGIRVPTAPSSARRRRHRPQLPLVCLSRQTR